jgi:carboxymethylenebutenolidase
MRWPSACRMVRPRSVLRRRAGGCRHSKIKAAVLVHHGELDTRLADTWPAYDAALKASNIPHEGYIYPKANHGFHNDTTPRYDEAAAKLAWTRTVDWFNKYLRTT